MDDDYEILPHHELEYLRKEVERIKKNPFGDTETGQTLLDSMNGLSNAITRLTSLLTTANDELVRDYHENKTSERMERMVEQNQKLAQGIVAVGELVKSVLKQEKKNIALQGGLVELSDFTTDIKKAKTNKPHKPLDNPFDLGVHSPGESVNLDSTNLPRQSFSELDPSDKAPDEPPSFADELSQIPPASGIVTTPIIDDDVPPPP